MFTSAFAYSFDSAPDLGDAFDGVSASTAFVFTTSDSDSKAAQKQANGNVDFLGLIVPDDNPSAKFFIDRINDMRNHGKLYDAAALAMDFLPTISESNPELTDYVVGVLEVISNEMKNAGMPLALQDEIRYSIAPYKPKVQTPGYDLKHDNENQQLKPGIPGIAA